jgi:hypothetical protein
LAVFKHFPNWPTRLLKEHKIQFGGRYPLRGRVSVLVFGWGRQQRHHGGRQLLQAVTLGEDHIEAGFRERLRSELFAGRRKADNLHPGKDAAKGQSRLSVGGLRHTEVEEDQVAIRLPRLLDADDTVVCLSAKPVRCVDLEEGPDGVTDGGAVVDDKDSRHT